MKKLLAVIGLCAALAVPASAQLTITGVGGGSGGAAASPTWTNFTTATNTSCGFGATCDFTSVVVPTGFIVVGALINNQGGSTVTISAMSLSAGCSGSLTQAQTNSIISGGAGVGLFYGTVTGGTCTVTVTTSASGIQTAGLGLGLLSNLSSTTPGVGCQAVHTVSNDVPYNCSGSVTVPAGGYDVCIFGYTNVTALTSSNLTIDSQATAGVSSTAVRVGIGNARTTLTPAYGGIGFVSGGIACAPWS
jgi:hypothetical protein